MIFKEQTKCVEGGSSGTALYHPSLLNDHLRELLDELFSKEADKKGNNRYVAIQKET